MRGRKIAGVKLTAVPLILGILSFLTFGLYYYSANHAPYTYTDVILAAPIFSFIGMIVSIITRKSRKQYPALWTSGLVICLFGFILCVLVIALLAMIIASAFNGTFI